MSDETEPQEPQSAERKHGGHNIVTMATTRYDILLNIDRAREWKHHRLESALEDALHEINSLMMRELRRGTP